MPWTPTPTPPVDPVRQGWSPTGPAVPIPDVQQGWTPELWRTVGPLTGEGTLVIAAHTYRPFITTSFTGTGTLAATGYTRWYQTGPQLSGAGTLATNAYAETYQDADLGGGGTLTGPTPSTPARGPQSQSGAGTWSAPWWARYCDVILVGGGASGQTGNGAFGGAGKGGNPGVWATTTVDLGQFHGAWSITLAIGTGGPQAANSDLAAPNPGTASTASWTGGGSLSGAGGSGTVASGQNGGAPGNQTYQGVTYTGGAGGTGNAGSGTAPGGAGAGGNGGIFGSRTRGGPGGNGGAWLVFRQN